MGEYIFIFLSLSYSGDIRGIPIAKFPDAISCNKAQETQEKSEAIILVSACVPAASPTIIIKAEPKLWGMEK